LRLQNYDYSTSGAYFITICTQERINFFGQVDKNAMRLNSAGQLIQKCWLKLSDRFSNVNLDTFVVMPNHFHGILILDTGKRAPTRGAPTNEGIKRTPTIGEIVGGFKSITTNEYIKRVKTENWKEFPGKLWHRNFYEHVIRNEKELELIRAYIEYNPLGWFYDPNNVLVSEKVKIERENHLKEHLGLDNNPRGFLMNLDSFA